MTSSGRSIPTADRISDLPDSILCHILSFLSTMDAASTSVLSKRWRPLWLSLFTLHFDDTSFQEISPSRIFSAMHSTLHQRDIALPIHSFIFISHHYSFFNLNDINQFIEIVSQRGIQNFTLDLKVSSFKLPQSILNCETLEVLNLKGVKFGDISHLQDLHLPKLKTLHLNNIRFECNQQLYNLLLRCPLLQDFESKHSIYFKYERILCLPETFKALPNLIKVTICEDLVGCPLSMFHNAKILHLDTTMPFCFVNLVLFHNAPMFPRLTHLELYFEEYNWDGSRIWLLALLKHSPKLQNLIIQDTRVLAPWEGECWEDPQIVPECLLSELKTCCITGYKCDLEFAKYVIENSKVLNSITIHGKCSIGMNDKDKMLEELSSCTRASTTCELLFD